jgi:hypothetical protein
MNRRMWLRTLALFGLGASVPTGIEAKKQTMLCACGNDLSSALRFTKGPLTGSPLFGAQADSGGIGWSITHCARCKQAVLWPADNFQRWLAHCIPSYPKL